MKGLLDLAVSAIASIVFMFALVLAMVFAAPLVAVIAIAGVPIAVFWMRR